MSCQESIRRTARCCRCPGWICENRSVQFGSLQNFPRPFTCEFCDIIVMIFGRRPRLKKSEQVLAELEAFRRAALRSWFVVDDNLIGNKNQTFRAHAIHRG
jgi:hypothetical protein